MDANQVFYPPHHETYPLLFFIPFQSNASEAVFIDLFQTTMDADLDFQRQANQSSNKSEEDAKLEKRKTLFCAFRNQLKEAKIRAVVPPWSSQQQEAFLSVGGTSAVQCYPPLGQKKLFEIAVHVISGLSYTDIRLPYYKGPVVADWLIPEMNDVRDMISKCSLFVMDEEKKPVHDVVSGEVRQAMMESFSSENYTSSSSSPSHPSITKKRDDFPSDQSNLAKSHKKATAEKKKKLLVQQWIRFVEQKWFDIFPCYASVWKEKDASPVNEPPRFDSPYLPIYGLNAVLPYTTTVHPKPELDGENAEMRMSTSDEIVVDFPHPPLAAITWNHIHERILAESIFENALPQWEFCVERNSNSSSSTSSSIISPTYIKELYCFLTDARKHLSRYSSSTPAHIHTRYPLVLDGSSASQSHEMTGDDVRSQYNIALQALLTKRSLEKTKKTLWRKINNLQRVEERLFEPHFPYGLTSCEEIEKEMKSEAMMKQIQLPYWPSFIEFTQPCPHLLVIPSHLPTSSILPFELWIWFFNDHEEEKRFFVHRYLFAWSERGGYVTWMKNQSHCTAMPLIYEEITAKTLYEFISCLLPRRDFERFQHTLYDNYVSSSSSSTPSCNVVFACMS